MCALGVPAAAQPKKGASPAPKGAPAPAKDAPAKDTPAPAPTPVKKGPIKEQTLNLSGLGVSGNNRSPQLLYFLERANEELERASLERRSFIPHLVRTVEDEAL
ncbi:MAG: hypothetical protein H0T89_24120 [Deltaproteobacteria bacterium]|nr:hypothetical protein [Deltaproteobacteria bacterium]MDQ3298094.1 hypothetical protein [Myxococcota bacterium]